MTVALWFLAAGLLLVGLALTSHLVERLPVSTPAICLAVGLAIGPGGLELLSMDMVRNSVLFMHLTEIAVIVSLFTVGLHMRSAMSDRRWWVPIRLATISMILTIGGLALLGTWLGLPLGAAILLGGVLAPTDPVLAGDVQLEHISDRDKVRFGLTGEAGLNDGLAFPFVMLGLGILGLHPREGAGFLGLWGEAPFDLVAWLGWDVAWAVTVGLGVGGVVGWVLGHLVVLLQRRRDSRFTLHESLALGFIALAYGLAELAYGYGFLAVFAAGYALRYIEMRAAGHSQHPAEVPPVDPGTGKLAHDATLAPEQAAQYVASALGSFNEKLEHLLMAGVIVIVGGVISLDHWTLDTLWVAPLLFLVIRPLSVWLGLIGSPESGVQKGLTGWFGVRGIGSVYYLTFAMSQGLSGPLSVRLNGIVLSVVVLSVLVHGATVTPLMAWYRRR